MIRDINSRFIRARFPDYSPERAEQVLDQLEKTRGRHDGVAWDDLLQLPDRAFFRRKGESAFTMIGVAGERFDDADAYLRYLSVHLPEPYMASRDLKGYADVLRKVTTGEMSVKDGIMKMPRLKRVGGTCPCSRSVRWVMAEPASSNGH